MGIPIGNDRWQVCLHTHTPAGISPDLSTAAEWNWQEMQLPFDGISWLASTGHGPDPFIQRNDLLYHSMEDVDWVLRKTFSIRPGAFSTDDELQLFVNRLDCFAEIYLNGIWIGRTRNQFHPFLFDIDDLRLDTENEILIYIRSARRVNTVLESASGQLPAGFDTARVQSRRCQSLTSWDWAPRLSSVSLLEAPSITSSPALDISAIHAYATHISPVDAGQPIADEAQVIIEVELQSRRRATGEITWQIVDPETGEIVAEKTESINLKAKAVRQRTTLAIPGARLWWPVGFGDQPTYIARASISATDRAGLLDYAPQKECTFGVRTITIEQKKDTEGESFLPRVNGIPIFCRGAKWIPVDMLASRATPDRYRQLIATALAANINCLRVWGGGIYETDEFYDLCDKAGILIWQDFMFSCGAYPTYREFLDEVETEAIYQVQRLRNHPCIMLWCGNDENEWLHQVGDLRKGSEHRIIGEIIWSTLLRKTVEDYAPQSFYHQSSPYGKNRADSNDMASGDRHSWEVWGDWQPSESYLFDKSRFVSEFGVQSLPAIETIRTIAPEATSMNSSDLAYHQRMVEGNARLVRYVAELLPLPHDLEGWVNSTQLMQATVLERAVSHWRTRRFATAGCLLWQFADAYPAISWSIIDYYGRPKKALQFAQRFFAPVYLTIELRIDDTVVATIAPDLWAHQAQPAIQVELEGGEAIACDQPKPWIECRLLLINDSSIDLGGTLDLGGSSPAIAALFDSTEAVVVPANEMVILQTGRLTDEILSEIRSTVIQVVFIPDSVTSLSLDNLQARVEESFRVISPNPATAVLRPDIRAGLTLKSYLVSPKHTESKSQES